MKSLDRQLDAKESASSDLHEQHKERNKSLAGPFDDLEETSEDW